MSLPDEIRKAIRLTKNRVLGYFYRDLHIARQLKELESYDTGITDIIECAPLDSATYVAFVYYERQEDVSPSVQRILTSLRAHGANTIVLCNHELAPAQRDFIAGVAHSIILRDNQGFDFGAYKDAVNHLVSSGVTVERLALLNDSVFYASSGLDEFVKNLLGTEDVIAAHENWGEDHHLQSFALSVSGFVFDSAPFTEFWRSYVPVNNRIHAIEQGEKQLTRAILQVARSSQVIYNVAELERLLLASESDLTDKLTVYPTPWRLGLEKIDTAATRRSHIVNKVIDVVNVTSTIHSGAYLFPKLMNSPLFKKDLVYRHRFQFWEVESWVGELMPPAEAEEFMTMLRKRRDASSLDLHDRRRFNVGVK